MDMKPGTVTSKMIFQYFLFIHIALIKYLMYDGHHIKKITAHIQFILSSNRSANYYNIRCDIKYNLSSISRAVVYHLIIHTCDHKIYD